MRNDDRRGASARTRSPSEAKCGVLLIVLILSGALGCATPRESQLGATVHGDEVAQWLGNIAVVFTAEEQPLLTERPPIKENLAGKYARRGAYFGHDEFPDVGGDGHAAAFALAWMPVGAALGSVVGAIAQQAGEKKEPQIQQAFAALTTAISENRLESTLRDDLLREIRTRTSRKVSAVPLGLFKNAGELIHEGCAFGTLLLVRLEDAALSKPEGLGSAFALRAQVRFRIIRVRDGRELDDDVLGFRSEKRKFLDWAADNAQPFRDALHRCREELSQRIAQRLFLAPSELAASPSNQPSQGK